MCLRLFYTVQYYSLLFQFLGTQFYQKTQILATHWSHFPSFQQGTQQIIRNIMSFLQTLAKKFQSRCQKKVKILDAIIKRGYIQSVNYNYKQITDLVAWRCSIKKVLLETYRKIYRKKPLMVSFQIKLHAGDLQIIKTPKQVFSIFCYF